MDEDRSREKKNASFLANMQKSYIHALRTNPLITKSITSGVVCVAASLTGQLIDKRKGNIDQVTWPPALRYGAYGFVISGPIMHYFYKWLDHMVPAKSTEANIKRLLIERILFTPLYMFVFHSVMAGVEFKSIEAVKLRLKMAYWITLVMNWKYGTLLQIININYIPAEMKVLFGNLCGYLFNIYLTSLKPSSN